MQELIRKFWLLRRNKSNQGFTLIEILVGTVISLIIVTGLLSAMVEILTKDREEGILTQTQQDMERAIKFIYDDIRESVYVYDFTQPVPVGTCGENYPLCGLPTNLSAVGTPIIAFWKIVPLVDSNFAGLNCATVPNASNYITERPLGSTDFALTLQGECIALQNRRKMYSLVVYVQATNPDPNWKGQSRILRYEFSKYNPAGVVIARNAGFVDPSYTNNFVSWPYQLTYNNSGVVSNVTNLQPTIPAVAPSVLVDFVDDPSSTADAGLPVCGTGYTRRPATNAANSMNTSFFACVTTIPTNNGRQLVGQNQDVTIYLRGNAAGQPGLQVIPGTYNTVLPPLQTRVTLRGVIDKSN